MPPFTPVILLSCWGQRLVEYVIPLYLDQTAMSELTQLVVFRLDEERYALRLDVVERIVQAAEVTPLPNAPTIVLGLIDLEGRVLPVLNVRRRFRLPEREIGPADQFLIARTERRTV